MISNDDEERQRRRRLRVYDDVAEAACWTPMVRLRRCFPDPDLEVFGKLEYLNPMGSVKDRLARHLVASALADGRLRAGGTLVEASSGNTAAGLAMMAILEGLRCRMVVRRETSEAKLSCLRALGVELELVDGALPPEDPASYNRRARVLAAELEDSYFPDQHNNPENCEAHYRTTGPEIWEQMEGRIDVFVAGIGTGGTVSGVGRCLKERDPSIRVVAVDVEGSVFSDWFHHRRVASPGPYRVEGLGDEEIIGCPDWDVLDDMVQVSDRAAFAAARQLARTEAIFAGGSSGAALWGVQQVVARARDRPRVEDRGPLRIVTLFPDSGTRYLGTLYDDRWLEDRGLA